MRGSSALDRALGQVADVDLRAWVVWEPVLIGDRVPWRPTHRAMSDPRVSQSWDPRRTVSSALLAAGRSHPDELDAEERAFLANPDAIVWDTVLVWPPGAHWGDLPAFHGSDVVDVEDRIPGEIRRAAGR